MAVDWPDHFPCLLRDGYSVAQANLVQRTPFARGNRMRRQYGRGADRVQSATVFFTSQQWGDFQVWWRDAINRGSERANVPIRAGGYLADQEVLFKGPPQHALVGQGDVMVTLSFEAYVPLYYDEATYEYVKGWGGADKMWLALQAMETRINSEWLSV